MDTAVIPDGGATAPAEVAIPVEQVDVPQPLGNQTPVAEKPEPVKAEPKARETVSDTLRKAAADVKAKEAAKAAEKIVAEKAKTEAAKPEATAEAKPEKTRDETGRFTPREPVQEQPQKPAYDPPARFSADAKTEWAKSPPSVQAEVHRAFREMEAGIEKHRAAAQEFEQIREFHDLAREHGTSIKAALTNYTNLERTIAADPLKGLQMVADYAGLDLRKVAAHIMGQSPDQVSSQQDATIRELRQELAALKQSVGSVQQTFQQQRTETISRSVTEFAQSHPRFDELADAIKEEISHGYSLEQAYERAERLNPAPAVFTPPPLTPAKPALAPLNPAGQKSITGAPGNGSYPSAKRGPNQPLEEVVKRAFAHVSGR